MHQSVTDFKFVPTSVNVVAAFLFFLEYYHFIAHVCVLFRVRLLPRKDLVRIRYYFLIDAVTVSTVCFFYTGRLRWMAAIQFVQHMFFFLTWNKHSYTNKVINWSSLEWQQSPHRRQWEWDVILGTMYDIVMHACNAYILATYLSTVEILVAVFLVQAAIMTVLYSPRFAWASPSDVPSWVSKRIKPLDEQDKYAQGKQVKCN